MNETFSVQCHLKCFECLERMVGIDDPIELNLIKEALCPECFDNWLLAWTKYNMENDD